MTVVKYKTGEKVEVNTPRELKDILRLCNPSMLRHYKYQLPQLEIRGFGNEIEVKRK